jgi:trans-aconitate 2-methyltransferase
MYPWNARDYAKSSAGQQQWARELIAKLALDGDERLLDIGCGDGKITAEIAAGLARGSVVGVDSSPDMISLAAQAYPAERQANLRFEQADAAALPFDNEFDVVFSNAALHWVLDHRPVLRGIHRSLRPGGKILLQMAGRGNAAEVFEAIDCVRATPEWCRYFEGFSFPYGFFAPEEYGGWLAEAGLTAQRVELIPKDMCHPDRAAFEGWIRTTWLPYTQRAPVDKREAFIGQVIDAYLERHPTGAQAAIHLEMVRLEVEAIKP